MKQIKYKAWDNNNKKMAKVVALDWGKSGKEDVIVTCHLEYSDGTVEKRYPMKDYGDDIEFLEYINYKDLNEKELYQSDIIHYHRHEGSLGFDSTPVYKLGVIAWNDSALGYRIQPIDTHSGKVNYGVDGEKIRTSHRIVKVGNLYESDIWELIKKYKNGELE